MQGTVPSMLGNGMKYQVGSVPQRYLEAAQRINACSQKMELKFKTMRIWGQIAVVQTRVFNHCTIDPLLWGCPVHCRMFSGLPVLPLEVASSELYNKKMSLDIANVPWGAKSPPVEKHWYHQ